MGNDLDAPLGLAPAKRALWTRLPFGIVGGTLLGTVVVVAGVWQAFIHDPRRGEPTAVVRIDRSNTGIAKGDVAVAAGEAEARGDDAAAAGEARPAGAAESGEGGIVEAKPASGAGLVPVPRVAEVQDGQPLSTAPVARVSEKTRYGVLPKIAADGARPLDVYARPTPKRAASTPRIALIVGGLGISQTTTQEALRVLGADVTLAFAPYGASLDRWMQKARGDGHEILLQIPMEPFDYPDNDPGPQTLLTGATPEANGDRFLGLLGRLTNYVGVVNYMGAKFTAEPSALTGVVREAGKRGLVWVDDGSSSRSQAEATARATRTPFARADMVIDEVAREDAIATRLTQLEQIARSKGVAVGNATALPVTLKALQSWVGGLEARGLVLVPVSSLARQD